jgi:hypothetical protein
VLIPERTVDVPYPNHFHKSNATDCNITFTLHAKTGSETVFWN